MPSTTEPGPKPAPKRQTAKKAAEQPKPETAPAAPAPTPPAPPTGESMFDDTPPAPPAAEQPPVERAAPSEASDTPADAPQGDQVDGGAQEPQGSGDPAPAEPSATDTEDGPAPAPTEPQAPQEPVGADTSEGPVQAAERAPSGSPVRVRLGRAEGVLHRVPLGVVQMLVAESGSRIATLQSSPTIADLQNRMRVSEGRCAPIFFTMEEGNERPYLFAGIEAVAAAINLDLEVLSVVTINAGDAGAAQQHLASRANGRPASSQDDVLEVIE